MVNLMIKYGTKILENREKKLSVENPQIDAREDFDEESKNKRMLEYAKKWNAFMKAG